MTITVDLGRKATKTNKANKMNAVYIEHVRRFIKTKTDHSSHARDPLYSNSAVIAWWLQTASAQNSVHSS